MELCVILDTIVYRYIYFLICSNIEGISTCKPNRYNTLPDLLRQEKALAYLFHYYTFVVKETAMHNIVMNHPESALDLLNNYRQQIQHGMKMGN